MEDDSQIRNQYRDPVERSQQKCITNPRESLSFVRHNYKKSNSLKDNSTLLHLNLHRTNQIFQRFAITILIFIFVGILVICGGIFYQIYERNVSCFAKQVKSSWTNWSSWTQHNETSGVFARRRNCLIIPKIMSNECKGLDEEFFNCKDKDSKQTLPTGIWSMWSQWSSCTNQCKTHNKIPTSTRNRICIGSEDNKKELTSCFGENVEHQFCQWLSSCPDSHWSEWTIFEPCTLRGKTPCGPGHQASIRKCSQPNCIGSDTKMTDCWSYVGCPTDIQSPTNVELISYGNGTFKVSWSVVPYGEIAQNVCIYSTMMSYSGKEIRTKIHQTSVYHNNIAIQNYAFHVHYSEYLAVEYFHTLSVRLQSVNINDSKSVLTEPISSFSRAVDGEWQEWGNFGSCSTKCLGEKGVRIRTRKCTNPSPSLDGKICPGISESTVSCVGLEENGC